MALSNNIRVLVVSSYHAGHISTYVQEQIDALNALGVTISYFGVKGHGFIGYLRNYIPLKRQIAEFTPNIIHAHYGLCGLLCNLQRTTSVVTTYHGSDINNPFVRFFSLLSVCLSACNIFVSNNLMKKIGANHHSWVIPCGINLSQFPIIDKNTARQRLKLHESKKYVLFGGQMNRKVKNGALAVSIMQMVPWAEMIELQGFTRFEVALLLNAVDCLLLTSHSEGSPQIIKEAMACNCPIVSVDVGDVAERLSGIDGCCVVNSRQPTYIAETIIRVLNNNSRSNGREHVLKQQLDNSQIANRLLSLYKKFGI